ncbi:hypothetical protein F6X40_09325 [Paraburkholderia sp. UCT31]|uniref:hypothetical protein n=1 Tax=Paraburkholderia sp. UCT31 TaxID=2615209 RepID=UPI001655947B|nr:hypothetical protein [Paraburkholderia sp. UCT31]MBC8737008.1 hypothetical protein [Paraburkholderia sp. UCT31]
MAEQSQKLVADGRVRLVVDYGVTDGCTYHCRVTVPVLYKSAEDFVVDFEAWCQANRTAHELKFAGVSFNPDNFFEEGVYYGPDVMTVDEWFASAE